MYFRKMKNGNKSEAYFLSKRVFIISMMVILFAGVIIVFFFFTTNFMDGSDTEFSDNMYEIEAVAVDAPEEWPGYPVTYATDKNPQTVFHTKEFGGWAVFALPPLSRVVQVRLLNRDLYPSQRNGNIIYVCANINATSCVECGSFGVNEVGAKQWGKKTCNNGEGLLGNFVRVTSPDDYLVMAEIQVMGLADGVTAIVVDYTEQPTAAPVELVTIENTQEDVDPMGLDMLALLFSGGGDGGIPMFNEESPIGDESGTTVDEIEATGDEIEATVADSPEEWPGYPVTFAIDKDPQTVFHTQDYGGWAVFEIRLSRVEQVRLLNRDKFPQQRDNNEIYICTSADANSCMKCGTFGVGEVGVNEWGTKTCNNGEGLVGSFVRITSPDYLVIAEMKIFGWEIQESEPANGNVSTSSYNGK